MTTPCYAVVHNIPAAYHSKDLRAFFFTHIESNAFDCFHFKHRPETKANIVDGETSTGKIPVDNESKNPETEKTCCCVVRFRNFDDRHKFIRFYLAKPWTNVLGKPHAFLRCFVAPLKNSDELTSNTLPELRPAKSLLPQGNIGTPGSFFREKISNCTLPASLIKQLGLTVEHQNQRRRIYSQVPPTQKLGESGRGQVDEEKIARDQRGRDEDAGQDDDCDDCQEYERHEAFYDDVTDQERSKERLFEEEMEIVWEKGGPGLVFYTDSFFWDQLRGTDTDERWADDWDVDMAPYYNQERGDRDAEEMAQIRRNLADTSESVFKKPGEKKEGFQTQNKNRFKQPSAETSTGFGEFERHTKGVGRRLMQKQGWCQGAGLGAEKNQGRLVPVALDLEDSALQPFSKSGIGYTGERLDRKNLKRQAPKRRITTVYDRKDDSEDGLLRRNELTHNKRR